MQIIWRRSLQDFLRSVVLQWIRLMNFDLLLIFLSHDDQEKKKNEALVQIIGQGANKIKSVGNKVDVKRVS